MGDQKLTIAIAGASGFIGRWFIKTYNKKYRIVALTRKEVLAPEESDVEWRVVDLYSLSSTTKALEGVDVALYLVHSMTPSSSLNQARFEDTDLLLADNFRLAAASSGLSQIIYVGGILPKDESSWSRHLISRYEVEQTLAAGDVPMTALRAGIIIGPGGSSFQIVERLVKNLPVMACPKWTQTNCQPIDVNDIVTMLDQCIGNKRTLDLAIEVGGTHVTTYRELIAMTALALGKKRWMVDVPFFTIGLSKLWVSLFTRTAPTFISPLVESLKHQMTLDRTLQDELFDLEEVAIQDSIKKALYEAAPSAPKRKAVGDGRKNVRSVQRIANEDGLSVRDVAFQYFDWLGRAFRPFIRVQTDQESTFTFCLLGIPILKLAHQKEKRRDNREVFYIIGGALARRTDLGWLEFRGVLNNQQILTGIHEYVPKLPWTLYKATQAQLHLWVMRLFARRIAGQH